MSLGSKIAWDDTVLPFQLDRSAVRGRVARLDGVLDQVLAQHNYPPEIEALVAEAALLTALIGQAIKLRWKLSLQIRGDGPARLIATDYYAPGEDGAPGRADLAPDSAAAIRLLALTGMRRGEVVNLRWREVDTVARTITLTDSKTGRSVRPLSRRAADLLSALGRRGPDELVFQGARSGAGLGGLQKTVQKVTAAAGLSGVTSHTLRHSFASVAADGGASELAIASLLGHAKGTVTSRYVHAADSVLLAAADRVADEIAAQIGEAEPTATVIELPTRARA